MAVYAVRFFLLTALLWSDLATPDRDTITIGVILDMEIDVGPVSRSVNNATASYLKGNTQQHPDVALKWIFKNSTSPALFNEAVSQMFDDRADAVITALRCPLRRTVAGMAERFRIPHISLSLDLCSSKKPKEFTIDLNTEFKDLVPAVVDIARAADRKHMGLKFNNLVDYSTRQYVIFNLSSSGIRTVLMEPTTEKTSVTGMISSQLIWVVMMNAQQMKNPSPTDNNMILVTAPSAYSLAPAGLLFLTSVESLTFLETRIANTAVLIHQTFLSVTEDISSCDTDMACSPDALDYHEDITVMQKLKRIYNNCGYRAHCDNQTRRSGYDLCGVLTAPHPQLTPVGHWTEKDGLTVNPSHPEITNRLFPNKLTDFGGVTLRVAVVAGSSPYVNLSQSRNGSYHGLSIDILDDLAKKLNFKYTFLEPPDGLYGVKLENGSFFGMVELVRRGDADLGAAPFTITSERSEAVDFTTPYLQDSLGIMTPKPKQTPNQFQAFKPFKLEIWLAILTSVFTANLMCVLFSFFNPTCLQTSKKARAFWGKSIKDNSYLVISSYFEQGPTFYPKAASARCFLTFWFILAMLIMAMYTAHLAAVLTVSTPVRPINSIQDLAERTDMDVRIGRGSSALIYIEKSAQPAYRAIAKRRKYATSFSQYLQGVMAGKESVIGDRRYLEFKAAESCGETRVADEKMNGFSLAFIIAKGSPYKDAIDISIQRMVESGLVDRLVLKWMTPSTNCTKEGSKASVRHLGLDTLGGVFIVYGIFAVLAVFVLLIRFIYMGLSRRVKF